MIEDISWHWLLELKLRKTNGNAFQDFFSDVMEACHGSDFVRIKPYGKLGDSGCDGYLNSTGDVFACYGAQNGAAPSVNYVVTKLKEDFEKAKENLSDIMNCWHMTHNFIEGVPVEAVEALNELKKANPETTLGFFAQPNFREIFSEFNATQRSEFLGPCAQNTDYQRLQISEVRELVGSLIDRVESGPLLSGSIEPVSPKKLEYNQLSPHSAYIIQSGRANAPYIANYFDQHPDTVRGEEVAKIFRERYKELRDQNLKPDSIMFELYGYVAGPGEVNIPRQVATSSILSYLFESCDIFENVPSVETIQ